MNIYDLMLARRSVRKFKQRELPDDLLERMVNTARLAPSGANLQPLSYIVVTDRELRETVFSTLGWAKMLTPPGTPPPGCEPTAYIIMLKDERIHSSDYHIDVGLSAANLLLTGLAEGVAGCIIQSFSSKFIRQIFSLPEYFKPELVIALGYPNETPTAVDRSDTVRYWRDEQGHHFVPKRPLSEIMFVNPGPQSWPED